MAGVTPHNIAAHTTIQIDLSAIDANPEAQAGDYKAMYESKRDETERLRTQLKGYQHVLDVEVKENQRRHDKIWDLEEALKKKKRKMAKLEQMLIAALTAD
jgi:predicted RNase H-like nuclease (RuvC/YqgF family)